MKKRFTRKRRIAAGILLAAAVLFFIPFNWRLSLPGEVRYEMQNRLIAEETGFIRVTPGEVSRSYSKGETIFELSDPLLFFARERVQHMLRYDSLLFEQQRMSRKTIGDSLLTGRRVSSDMQAAAELERKIRQGKKTASENLIFIPEIGRESKDFRVVSGTVLGKLCAGKLIVRAYADDQDIKHIRSGQKVRLLVKDRLAGVSGKVRKVYYIPVVLRDSPALAAYGGEIPVDFDENDPEKPRSYRPVYFVDIQPDRPLVFQCGRFVRAEVSYRITAAARIWQLLLSAFRREI
ncbi:MAG: HlyD family secretion protein [Lentisphaeria bacterium]|nr:HlyD family secretion protein [Lentisphaeria bacterium]